MTVQLPKYVRYCFDDRYDQLKALGIVDDKTVQISHEEYRGYVARHMSVERITKQLNIPSGTINNLKALERKLNIIDKQGVEAILDGNQLRKPDYSDVPGISEVSEDDTASEVVETTDDTTEQTVQEPEPAKPVEPLAFIFDASKGSKAGMRAAICTAYCKLRNIPVGHVATRGTLRWQGEDDKFFKAVRRVKPGTFSTLVPEGCTGYTHVVIWDLGEFPEDMRTWLVDYCAGNSVEIVEIAKVRSDWHGLMQGMDDADMKRGWNMFVWAHEDPNWFRTCSTTVILELEDVMDLARAGIPIRMIAKAYNISPIYIERALQREGVEQSYEMERLAAVSAQFTPSEPEVASEPVVDSEPVVAEPETVQEPDVVREDDDGSEIFVTEPKVEEPRPEPESVEEPAQDVEEPTKEPQIPYFPNVPVVKPTVGGADGIEDNLPDSERRFTVSTESVRPKPRPVTVPEGCPTLSIDQPMMTVSGAKGIVETIVNGTAPDMDLWTETPDGLTIDTYRLSLRYREGSVFYSISQESEVVKAVYTKAKEDVLFDRAGRIYRLDGFLTIRLSDFSAVEVPIVSDTPLNTKRWIA